MSILIIIILVAYLILLYILKKKGMINDKGNIRLKGPLLFLHTTKGSGLIERLASHKNILKLGSNIGIVFSIISLTFGLFLILGGSIAMTYQIMTNTLPAPGRFNEVRNMFLIPGINEFIPLLWGIIALFVAVVVHELGHAVMCVVHKIRIKSTGIVIFLLPIGAFVEPDEGVLLGRKTRNDGSSVKRIERLRVFASGVAANFIISAAVLALFFSLFGTLVPAGPVDIAEPQTSYISAISSIPQNLNSFNGLLSLMTLPFVGLDSNMDLANKITETSQNHVVSLSDMLTVPSHYFKTSRLNEILIFPFLSFLLWVGWINLMVGLFNSLPMLPLDGGHIFRDASGVFMEMFVRDEKRIDRLAMVITFIFSILVLISIIFSSFAPLLF